MSEIDQVSIEDIKAKPQSYQDEMVVVKGEYQGWSPKYGAPPVTRSDWVIVDETGGIYVAGENPRLDPVKDLGKIITVVGKVGRLGGRVYLTAEKVIIGRD
jgi:hypothetical protein